MHSMTNCSMNIHKKVKYCILMGSVILIGCSPSIYHKITKNNSQVQPNDSLTIAFNEICVEDSFDIMEVFMDIESVMMASVKESNNETIYDNAIGKITAKNASISKSGKDLIKSFESCSLTAYMMKGEKYYTIGYGHVIYPGDNTPHKISKKKADSLFDSDMEKYNALARELLGKLDKRYRYNQGFIDGLVSLIYNCGQSGVEKTRFWKAMEHCRYDKKTKNINIDDLRYAISFVKTANISSEYKNGHINRRKAEQSKMLAEL